MKNDYETFPMSRKEIRVIAKTIRNLLHITETKIPVIKLLDILEMKYGLLLSIELDECFDKNVVAYLTEENNTFIIHVRNSVYDKACEGKRDCIGFICHEMCHYFLISWFGYTPIYGRTLGNKRIDRFRSMEWQAKALCGELMIPYYDFLNADVSEIMKKTDSSFRQARYYIDTVRPKQ